MLDLLPDLFDQYADDLQLVSLHWQSFGLKSVFHGQVVTVSCFEDNSKVKQLLASPGKGRVLVVDGKGSMNKALLGDLIAKSAIDNQWEGIIIRGCIRDVATINTLNLGVKALGTHPIKTEKFDKGSVNIALKIGQVTITPEMYIYADLNGVAVSHKALDITNLS
ncbi:putative 4-hydroxy-4-methyl-2-oxoglutarate aldolase [Shewanella intestini]|uniref:4-hydroxy-4-methyl-2-oxoglutarate aldolase n=1 Tax=Shewanella intestini TaxID=2017544 RepID=A0ABS5I1F6_9GAMM|nr:MULTISPECIES: putative 4-hydroxy-4-methyl-2-oxoglutarate aldolase [Shewanella]MBR9727864.1 putative 4-hydroxy-4-methyl-2-oxoglutarate aldolase [Shewanella intestini]MRG36143.1 putative 4-hydroxy-4-methyl-2-oxoglutarate aldolase [Shewanella sp. XMDDZSB0408]